MDLLIKNAKLRDKEDLVDIGIENKKIVRIEKNIKLKAKRIIDAAGHLTVPTFIDPHIHLDKVLTFVEGRNSRNETLNESIYLMQQRKLNYTIDDVKRRATEVIKLEVQNGCTIIRTHVDIDNIVKLTALEGVLAAKEECRDIADIQIVAFPQEGIIQNEGTEDLMIKAMEMGADVVGGMPANEITREDSKKHVDICFNIAKRFDADLDIHTDETKDPNARSLEYIAAKTIKEGYEGRVTCDHCVSLAYQDRYHAEFVINLLKKAEINVISNPICTITLGIDEEPRTRSLTRIRELVDAGINLSCGQDTVADGFHLYGQADPLEVLFLMAYCAQYNTIEEANILFDFMTINAAKILRLDDYGIKVGNTANLNIIRAPNIKEAIRNRADRLYVIKDGKIVAQNETKHQIFRGNDS